MIHDLLIIDDDPAIHAMVGVQLGSGQTNWLSALDGVTGIALAEDRKPDLILLDVDMPDLNGHEVCRRLKSNPKTRRIPILFLTAAASPAEKVIGLDLGAVDYITKPFDPFEVRARTRAALRARFAVDDLTAKSMVDDVTGLYNRAYLVRQLPATLAQARRWNRPLACVLVEIDRFQEIGREFGREGADAVLRCATGTLRQTCREEDLLCRSGDSQFTILAFSHETDNAVDFAERVRKDLHSRPALHRTHVIQITASCGVALSQLPWGQIILTDAEGALRQSMHDGGDRVTAAGEVAQLHCG